VGCGGEEERKNGSCEGSRGQPVHEFSPRHKLITGSCSGRCCVSLC
jgi:hypothetical protein